MERTFTLQLSEIVAERDISYAPLEGKLNSHDAAPVQGLLLLFSGTMHSPVSLIVLPEQKFRAFPGRDIQETITVYAV